jgi:hypothetical protein
VVFEARIVFCGQIVMRAVKTVICICIVFSAVGCAEPDFEDKQQTLKAFSEQPNLIFSYLEKLCANKKDKKIILCDIVHSSIT